MLSSRVNVCCHGLLRCCSAQRYHTWFTGVWLHPLRFSLSPPKLMRTFYCSPFRDSRRGTSIDSASINYLLVVFLLFSFLDFAQHPKIYSFEYILKHLQNQKRDHRHITSTLPALIVLLHSINHAFSVLFWFLRREKNHNHHQTSITNHIQFYCTYFATLPPLG